jgi:hypothetical protein
VAAVIAWESRSGSERGSSTDSVPFSESLADVHGGRIVRGDEGQIAVRLQYTVPEQRTLISTQYL